MVSKDRLNKARVAAFAIANHNKNIDRVVLYGSTARGEPSANDIDLCVILRGKGLNGRIKRLQSFLEKLDRAIIPLKHIGIILGEGQGQIHVEEFPKAQLRSRTLCDPTFRDNMLRDGLTLWKRETETTDRRHRRK